jgi:N-ethylmaleimide reductase
MKLFEPTTLGTHTLKNRMAMAPMTRSRADAAGVVGDLTVLYYTQRSSAGFIVTEAINISEQARGNPLTPGLFRQDQVEAWKKVTQAAHEKGSVIFAQLWHTGRVGHSVDRNGALPVAPSAIGIQGQQHFTSRGMKAYETPRALSTAEVRQIIPDYRQAALNAIAAGFDGVELHAANGYLPNQFLADSANQRTDEYGGSIANKSRFVLEVMEALVDAVGGDRVGIRLSPTVPYNDIHLDDPVAQFSHLIGELDKMPLAYMHLMNSAFPRDRTPHYPEDVMGTFGTLTRHTLIANGGYSKASGEMQLEKGGADIISFGALFLANPDLPERFALDAPLNQADRATMFGGAEKGYTDYSFLAA